MKKYEYEVRGLWWVQDYQGNIEEGKLNEYGQDGWELVCIEDGSLIFKREIEDVNDETPWEAR